jgi:hypothetical protein
MVGTRIRLQSLLSYLLLETIDIRHYLFRIRDRSDVVIRYVVSVTFAGEC